MSTTKLYKKIYSFDLIILLINNDTKIIKY